tara:strand:- start:2876 stop:3301 length:426 start_codon:yes stop_codon:yes gene_type:complete
MITGIVKGLLLSALQNWAKEAEKGCNEVQLGFSVAPNDKEDQEKKIVYTKIVNGTPSTKVSFLQVLNKKTDMLGQEAMATPLILKSILAFSEELKCPQEEIFVIAYSLNPTAQKNKEVRLHLYNSVNPQRPVTFDEIFQNG